MLLETKLPVSHSLWITSLVHFFMLVHTYLNRFALYLDVSVSANCEH